MAEYKTLYRRFIDEVFVGGNIDAVDEYVDAKFVEHEELPPGFPEGRDAVKAWAQLWHGAFSDIGVTIEDMVEDGDTVWARLRFSGTHTGEFMGIPATNTPVEFGGIDCLRFQEGKCVEHWGVVDMAALLMQIGALEAPSI